MIKGEQMALFGLNQKKDDNQMPPTFPSSSITLIAFTVDADIIAPQILSLYKTESHVYFTLDEEANCEYYFEDFAYGEGTSVSGSFSLTELSEYYFVCQDAFGNEGSWVVRV